MAKEKLDFPTILIQSISAYYLWMTLSAIFVFQQFNIFEILSVSVVFLCLFILLVGVFFSNFFKFSFIFTIQNVGLSFILFLLMMIVTNFSYLGVSSFFRIFTLLNTELGLGWSEDSVYHVSIIQSILHGGYPSIGQRDRIFLFYPVLSHYIDAFLLYITHLQPYDSYALFYHFHKFILYSTITTFIIFTFKNFKPYIFLFVFAISVPIIGEEHIVGSHSLWFTSVFLILTLPVIFNLLSKEKRNTFTDFLLIFIVIVILSFGKISTGFLYGIFVGFYLFIKQPKNKLVYIFGFSLIIFFLGYNNLMHGYSGTGQYGIDFTKLRYNVYYTWPEIKRLIISILISISLFAVISVIFRNKRNFYFLFATILSFLTILFITSINLAFNSSDIWYFLFGVHSIFFLFLLQNISINMLKYKVHYSALSLINKNIILLTTIISTFYISTLYVKAPIGTIWYPRSQTNEKFVKTNKHLNQTDKFSYKYKIQHPLDSYQPKNTKQALKLFRKKLYDFMHKYTTTKDNTVLYISKEIFIKDMEQFNGYSWARGMLIYAITGVPLVYGIEKLRTAYGYPDYDKSDLWKNKSDFVKEDVCKIISARYIIYVVNFNNPKFLLYNCEKRK